MLYIYIYITNQKTYCKCCGGNKDKNNNKLEGKENKKNKCKCSNCNKNKTQDNEKESEYKDKEDKKKDNEDNEDNQQHKDIFPDKEEKKNLLFNNLIEILNNNNLLTNKEKIDKENYEEKIKNIKTIENFNEINQNLNEIKNKLINNLNLEKNNLQQEFNKLKNDIDQLNNKEGDIDKILKIKIENNLLDINIFNDFDFNKIEEIKNKISNLKNIYNNGIIEIQKKLIIKLDELDKKNINKINSNINKTDIKSANDNENILAIYEKINTYQITIDKGIKGVIDQINLNINNIEKEKELLKKIGKDTIENDLNNFNNELNNNKTDINKLSALLTNINTYINKCDNLKNTKKIELDTKLNNLNEIKKYIIDNHIKLIKNNINIDEIKIDNIIDYNNTITNIINLENLIKTAINDIKNSLKTEIDTLNKDLEKYEINKIELNILDNLNKYSSSLEGLTKNILNTQIDTINISIENNKNLLKNKQQCVKNKQDELKKLLKEINDLNDNYKDFNDLKITVTDEKIDQTFNSSELQKIEDKLKNLKKILDIYENNKEKISNYIDLKKKIEEKIDKEEVYKDDFKKRHEEVEKLLNKEDLTNLDKIIEDLNEVRKYVFSKKYNDELLKILNDNKCGYDDIIKKLNSLNKFYFGNIVNNKLFLNNKSNANIILFDETIKQIEDNIGEKTVDRQKKINEFYDEANKYFYANIKDDKIKINEKLENIIKNMNEYYKNDTTSKNKYNIDNFSKLLKELYNKMKDYFTNEGIYRFFNKLCFLYHNGIIEKIIEYNDKKKYIILPNISEDVDNFIANLSYKSGKVLDKNGNFKEFRCDGKCKNCLSCIISKILKDYYKNYYKDILAQQKRDSNLAVPIYFKLYFNNLLQEKYKIKPTTDTVDKFGNTINCIPEDICIMNINYKKDLFLDTIDLMWALTYCILKFSNIFNKNKENYDDKIILYKVLYFDDIKDTIERRNNLYDLVTSTSVFGPYFRFKKHGIYPFCYKAEVEKFLCIYNYLFSFSAIGYMYDKELEIGYIFLDKFELLKNTDLDFIKTKDKNLYNKLEGVFNEIDTNVEPDKKDFYKNVLIGNAFCNFKTYLGIKDINEEFIKKNVLKKETKYDDFIKNIKSIPYYSKEGGKRVIKKISID